MRRAVLAAAPLILAGLALIGPGASSPAVACTPAFQTPTAQEFFDRADVVFEGVALSSRNPNAGAPIQSTADPVFYTFAADRVLKGSVSSQAVVSTAAGGATCGDSFAVGTRYRIYARNVSGSLTTDSVSGNRAVPLVAMTTTVPRSTQPSTAPRATPRSGPVRLTG